MLKGDDVFEFQGGQGFHMVDMEVCERCRKKALIVPKGSLAWKHFPNLQCRQSGEGVEAPLRYGRLQILAIYN